LAILGIAIAAAYRRPHCRPTLGHKNIQHTVRYTELAPHRFKDFWRCGANLCTAANFSSQARTPAISLNGIYGTFGCINPP